jgi:amino acid transporter
MRMFKISSNMATILFIPATYATAFGFIFAYGTVIFAMSKSGLFPSVFLETYGKYKTPHVAFLFGSYIGYAVVILVYFVLVVQQYLNL